jgi:tetratricopeptide (TPR) repeat protein
MIHHFPLCSAINTLSCHDFHHFHSSFSRVIKEKIVTATDIYFLEDAKGLTGLYDDSAKLSLLQAKFLETIQTRTPAAHDDCFFFPFPVHNEQVVMAVAPGVDRLLVKKAGHDWLQEIHDIMHREFLTLKQAGVDLQTGLLNITHLSASLDNLPEGESTGLVLVEIFPRVRTAMEGMQHLRRSVAALKSFTGEHSPLYHIGQSVFAFPCHNSTEDSVASFGPLIVSFLKREQFKHIHVGCSQGEIGHDPKNEHTKSGRQIFDEAWLSLQAACKRGPFSFCTYRSLQNAKRQLPYASDRKFLARIQTFWKHLSRFTLVQLHPAKATVDIYTHITLDLEGSKKFRGPGADVYLLLPFINPRKSLAFIKRTILSLTDKQKIKEAVAAGIATFPCSDFKKSEILVNCQKALLHGALLGEGKITTFTALSLNVSGDIFYGEGDIPRAVKEYRRGLLIAPHDINLLNSLGVSYAMMNRHRAANDCFLKALTIKKDDFMSWYNLGLGRRMQGNIDGAVYSFEQAGECPLEDEHDTAEARRELPLQLGKLYCLTRQHQKALDTLLPWHDAANSAQGSGRALRYLGESCHGIGRIREAMSWLQRAIRYDEFDADALSMLGEIYLDNNEGDQIALKLCEKSVELNPTSPLFKLRLARAQVQLEHLATARETLRFCISNKGTKSAARFQMGLIYEKLGQKKRARHWFSSSLTTEEERDNWHKNKARKS